MSSNEPCNCDQALALHEALDDLVREVVNKKRSSAEVDDSVVIDACQVLEKWLNLGETHAHLECGKLPTAAAKEQSRLILDTEVIDHGDIVLGANGYKAVPEEWVGKKPLDIGPRRWWGHMTEAGKNDEK